MSVDGSQGTDLVQLADVRELWTRVADESLAPAWLADPKG